MVDDTKTGKGKGFRLSSLKTDVAKSEEGVWCEVGEGFEIKVARLGHPKYQAYLAKLSKPHAKQIRREGLGAAEVLREIQRKATAKYLLLDWRNLHDDEGNEIPFSEEKALEILGNPEYEEFFDIVLEHAQDVELFRAENAEESAGNSDGS